MKKTMKTMLAFVAGAMALSACNNEDILNESENNGGAKLVTLTAYQEGDDATRAAIDGTDNTKINWTASDAIKVFGTSASAEYTTPNDLTPSTSASFTGEAVTGAAYALYPYQSSATNISGVITAEVPMTQYAVAGSFDPKAALMVGQVNAGSVQFKNVMSYVKVTIPSDMTNCKQVVLKAKDAWTTVAGKVKITASTGAWAETTAKEGQAFVRLVPTSPATTLEAGKSYYIAILPQTMATGFELIFNDNDVIKVKQASNSVTFARNTTKKLAAFSDFTYTVGTVSAGSITMADRNIGVGGTGTTVPTGADAYGDYFAWGALRPAYTKKPASGTTLTDLYWSDGFTASHVPSTFTDIASMLWGGKWRMPTNTEWNNNTSNSSVKGLPLAGYYDGTYLSRAGGNGYYWSSTPCGDGAYCLGTYGDFAYVYNSSRYYGSSVRPVLAQ